MRPRSAATTRRRCGTGAPASWPSASGCTRSGSTARSCGCGSSTWPTARPGSRPRRSATSSCAWRGREAVAVDLPYGARPAGAWPRPSAGGRPMRLRDGTSVWITGASSGIGAALVRELAGRGCRVAASARRAGKLEELAAAAGGEVLPVPADVTDRDAMLAAAEAVRAHHGAIDLVILNAANWDQFDVETWDTDVIRRHFDTNVLGMVHGVEAVL